MTKPNPSKLQEFRLMVQLRNGRVNSAVVMADCYESAAREIVSVQMQKGGDNIVKRIKPMPQQDKDV